MDQVIGKNSDIFREMTVYRMEQMIIRLFSGLIFFQQLLQLDQPSGDLHLV
jgi:hypothetical protein